MTIRARILRLLALGDVAPADPDELVVLTTVEPYEAPIVKEVLAQHGIESRGSDSLTPGTWVEKVSLHVARRDFDAATEVLRAYRQP